MTQIHELPEFKESGGGKPKRTAPPGREPRQEPATLPAPGGRRLWLAAAAGAALLAGLGLWPLLRSPAPKPAQVSGWSIPYHVVVDRSGRDFDCWKLIAIAPQDKSEANLRALGQLLGSDTRNHRTVHIGIFDEESAAADYDQALNNLGGDRPDGERRTIESAHWIGDYLKNADRGIEELAIHLEGTAPGHGRKTINLKTGRVNSGP